MNKLLSLLLISFCWSCTESSEVEKYQDERDNIVNVKEKIKEIVIEDVLIGEYATTILMGDYLFINDIKSYDKRLHIFDKKTFKYCTSAVDYGPGPSEITNMGHVAVDEIHNKFFVSDHGKQCIFSYDLDSVLADPFYVPYVKAKMNARHFPARYTFVNDTLSIAVTISPTGNYGFNQSVSKWNMNTGEITSMKYVHPEIKKNRAGVATSKENDMYIECHRLQDLITICNLNGDLKHNIYGPDWGSESGKTDYYEGAEICQDKIIVRYSGKDSFVKTKNGELKSNNGTTLLVFDLNGDYIKTLETEYSIGAFSYDKDNHRLILNLDEEIQFACLDLNGLVD